MADSRASGNHPVHIAIVGAGALGSVFASALLRADHAVTLLGRRPTPEITVCEPPCSVRDKPLHVETNPGSISSADFVLMLVKTYDTAVATEGIVPYLRPETTLVTLQNGLGNVDRLREHLPETQRVLAGVTSQAARRVSPGLVLHTGEGPTMIGYADETEHAAASAFARVLANAGIPAMATGDIDRFIWQKVAVNAAINGLTAVARVPNGELLQRPPLTEAADILIEEASSVASAYGYDLAGIHRTLKDTVAATSENRSSMLQDIEVGRPTEVDAIYGSLIAAARASGLATPALTVIDALVRTVSGYEGDQEDSK